MTEVDQLIAALADRMAIRELTARYNRAFDDVEPDVFASLFVEDGEMIVTGGPTTRGRPALAAMCRDTGFGIVHMTTDAMVEVVGDSAEQHCSLLVLARNADGSPGSFLTTGRYVDSLSRTPDGWQFRRRVATLDASLM